MIRVLPLTDPFFDKRRNGAHTAAFQFVASVCERCVYFRRSASVLVLCVCMWLVGRLACGLFMDVRMHNGYGTMRKWKEEFESFAISFCSLLSWASSFASPPIGWVEAKGWLWNAIWVCVVMVCAARRGHTADVVMEYEKNMEEERWVVWQECVHV